MPLFDRIVRLTADIMGVPVASLDRTSSADSVETWDSIRHLNLVLALEQEFELAFTPEEIEQMVSIELIEALVAEKLNPCETDS